MWSNRTLILRLLRYCQTGKSLGQTKMKNCQLLRYVPQLSKYDIGDFTYGVGAPGICSPKVETWGDAATLKIGKFCSFAPNVTIMLGNGDHRPDFVTTYPFNILFDEFSHIPKFPATKGDVIIGNDVWVCQGALILSGVTIGDGAVIGANSVVTKEVEPYSIVAGNPAKQVRKRFDQKTIDALLDIRWWNWNIRQIQRNMPTLLSNRVNEFIEKNRLPNQLYEAPLYRLVIAE